MRQALAETAAIATHHFSGLDLRGPLTRTGGNDLGHLPDPPSSPCGPRGRAVALGHALAG